MKMNVSNRKYKYLLRQMIDDNVIDQAFKNLRKHKTRRPEIKKIEANYEAEKEAMKVMIWNSRPTEDADPELGYKPGKRVPVVRYEHGKVRVTYEPEMHEQWLHHIIVIILRPIIERTAHPYSCGSLTKKGGHYGMRQLKRMIAKGKGIKYFIKIDIRHFFESTDIDVVIERLAIYIKDDWFLHIIKICYDGVKGLVLGFYLSQWLANYVLEPIDRLICEAGFEIQVRYMDDITVFSSNKRKLKALLIEIMKALGRTLRLRVKNNWAIAKFEYKGRGRYLDFMGFKFYRNRVTIRKRIMLKATRTARGISRKLHSGKRFYRKTIRAMVSLLGWFKWTDSYECYLERVKPFINVKRLKRLISRMDRRESRLRNERILRSQTA